MDSSSRRVSSPVTAPTSVRRVPGGKEAGSVRGPVQCEKSAPWDSLRRSAGGSSVVTGSWRISQLGPLLHTLGSQDFPAQQDGFPPACFAERPECRGRIPTNRFVPPARKGSPEDPSRLSPCTATPQATRRRNHVRHFTVDMSLPRLEMVGDAEHDVLDL